MKAGKSGVESLIAGKIKLAVFVYLMVVLLYQSGCSLIRPYIPPYHIYYEKLSAVYDKAQLKQSSSIDVLGLLRDPQYKIGPKKTLFELISQSDTVIAWTGKSIKRDKTWFTLFAFDEYTMINCRKYFFCIDENAVFSPTHPKRFLIPPRKGLVFDCQIVLHPDVLSVPFATDEMRQAAILQYVATVLQSDIGRLNNSSDQPNQGNKALRECGLFLNQIFGSVIQEIGETPTIAGHLRDQNGIIFDHISMDTGRVKMQIQDDLAAVWIRINVPME